LKQPGPYCCILSVHKT